MLAAVVAGVVSLLAPCCVSVMLPSYLAASAHNRGLRAAMALIFGAGVATIILPIAMGASLARRVLVGGHTWIYLVGGVLLIAMGVFTLAGGSLRLPAPTGRPARGGPWATYVLGVFSAVATSCCAPVLAGVIALSSATGSFVAALGLGLGYVIGMVAPLAVMAAFSERVGSTRLLGLGRRTVSMRIGRRVQTLSIAHLASGLLLIAMGVWSIASSGRNGMRAGSGWQAALSLWASGVGHRVVTTLAWIPGWVWAALLLGLAAWTVKHAIDQLSRPDAPIDVAETTIEEDRVDITN